MRLYCLGDVEVERKFSLLRKTMVNPAAVSAAVNVANFVINQNVNPETDSALLSRLENLSRENAVLGAPTHEKVVANSPMVKCLVETAGNGVNACAAGIAYVFFERRSQGKSSAARYFCRKNCKKSGCRSILIGASGGGGGGGSSYFQRVAADLGVEFASPSWARCLVAAMTKSPQEEFSPFLFLDEFNEGTKQDLQDLNKFMRACQNLGFYLIVITSERETANSVMNLNAWGKMRPLKYIHNGPTENVRGHPGYDENKTPNWKQIDWTQEQLKSVVVIHEGEFDDYSFITEGLTPTDALVRAREMKKRGQRILPDVDSNLSSGD